MGDFNFELPDHLREVIRRARELSISPEVIEAARRAREIGIPPGMAEALNAARGLMAFQLPAGYTEMIQEAQRNLAEAMRGTFPTYPDLTSVLKDVGRILRESWARAMPPNWVGLDTDEVMTLIDVVRETGFVVVWIPRQEILRDVLASPDEVEAILMSRRADVLDDVTACVTDVTADELQELRTAVEKAAHALADGHEWAAQALASTAFTTECHMLHGKTLAKAREAMGAEDPEGVGMSQLRLRTIYLAGNRALAQFDPEDGGAADFNRHNSAHRITSSQWNERNALSGVMLAAALLREMQYWIEVRDSGEQPEE